ncbi:MAG: PAS domain-containing protein [Candidatus Marinimicrobia bacterium]|nr:PAS domain-containing protein [Candidatus Neomarinimicrobiota bacterium]
MAVVLLSLWHPSNKYTIGVAVISSLLTVLGYLLSPEGGLFWMILYNRILALSAIWVTAILTIKRKKVEFELQKSERGLKRVLQIAKLGHWEWNILTEETVFSDEYHKIFNLEKDKSYSTDEILELIHPDDKARYLEILENSIKEKKGLTADYRIVLDSNEIKHIHSEWKVYADSENNPIKMAGTVQDITEQKKVLDDLTVSELNLNKAQEMAHVGSWDLDLRTNRLNWSDEVYRIFGLTPQEFGATYEAFVEAIHPDDREMVNEAYQEAVKNNSPYEVVHRVLRPDGEIRIVRERSEEILDSTGHAIRSVGTVHDITEMEESIRRAKKERNHFDKLLESLGEVVFIMNFGNRVIERVNSEIKSVFGYESYECVGQSTRMLCQNEEDFIEFGNKLQEAIKRGDEVVHIKQTFVKKNGETFPSEITLSFLKEAGKITHVISVVRDVSESERAERALRESEKRNLRAQEKAHLGHWDWNVVTNEAIVSDEFIRIWNQNREENDKPSSLEDFMESVHPEDKETVLNAVDMALKNIEEYDIDFRVVMPDNTIKWVNSAGDVTFDSEGKPVRMVGTLQDITERVKSELALREAKDKLEEKVRERTLELEKSHGNLKKSLEEKELLLKEIHHRVKNNLQIISSLLNLQANAIKDKNIVKNLMDMRSRVQSMSLIHENIYRSDDLSKVDVNNYVAMLTENLIQTYSEEGKSIKIRSKVGDITLDIDKAIPLGLIITELVTNAMQHAFIEKKSGIIDINLSEFNNTLEMIISDNGDGLTEGTGINEKGNLGFMLVKTLSDQLDADLDVKVSNGTKYTMSFAK